MKMSFANRFKIFIPNYIYLSPIHRKSSTIHKRMEVLVLVSVWHLNKLGIQFILHPHYTLLLTANKCTVSASLVVLAAHLDPLVPILILLLLLLLMTTCL